MAGHEESVDNWVFSFFRKQKYIWGCKYSLFLGHISSISKYIWTHSKYAKYDGAWLVMKRLWITALNNRRPPLPSLQLPTGWNVLHIPTTTVLSMQQLIHMQTQCQKIYSESIHRGKSELSRILYFKSIFFALFSNRQIKIRPLLVSASIVVYIKCSACQFDKYGMPDIIGQNREEGWLPV